MSRYDNCTPSNGLHRGELHEWVDVLTSGVADGPSAWDGYAAISVAESAVASLKIGQRTPSSW